MHFYLVALCALLSITAAAPANSKRYVVHERREKLPTHWNKEARLHDNAIMLPIRIALTQDNLHRAEEFLMDVSHPDSPNFGKHWTTTQVAEAFAPSDEAVDAVLQWLVDAGISESRVKQSKSFNWIHADVTVSEAEELLQTQYHVYSHAVSGQIHVACEKYSLPEEIKKHVDFVTPTLHFDVNGRKSIRKRQLNKREIKVLSGAKSTPIAIGSVLDVTASNNLDNCANAITLDCLRALYQIPTEIPDIVADVGSSYGIVEYSPRVYLPGDLDMFFRNFSPSLVGQRPTLNAIDGGFLDNPNETAKINLESDLDLQYTMALVAPQKVNLYQVGDFVEGATFNNFLDALDGSYCTFEGGDDPNIDGVYPDTSASGDGIYKGNQNCGGFAVSKVISTSYSFNEADLTPFYMKRQCYEYMKLGLQGVTFIYSSGDDGVAGNAGQCIDPQTGAYNNGTSGLFNPSFPSTCPYVTSVGATQVKPNTSVTATAPEKAAQSLFTSGGGFSSKIFPLPSYQNSAVSSYFAANPPPASYNISQSSRGFPDVSANGVRFVVALDGNFSFAFGTSASAPVFGSIITLINAQRLAVGKSSVGFINPALYKNPAMFNDIVGGGNPGCGTAGFQAVEGWDPVTGLGTPSYKRMLDYWLALP